MKKHKSQKITIYFRNTLLLLFLIIYIITSLALAAFETQTAESNADKMLSINVADIRQDILDTTSDNILNIAELVATDYDLMKDYVKSEGADTFFSGVGIDFTKQDPDRALLEYFRITCGLSEVSKIDSNGIITCSTNTDFIGFDMASGEQSSEFLSILRGENDYYAQTYQPISYDESIWRKYCGYKVSDGGFIQIGFDSERFRDEIDDIVCDFTTNLHVGETGYILIINEDGKIVSSPYSYTLGSSLDQYGITIEDLEAHVDGVRFSHNIKDQDYDLMGTSVEGYYIFAALPRSETLSSLQRTVRVTNFLEFLGFGSVFQMIYVMLKKKVVKNISAMADSLADIADGNLDVEVNVRGTSEFDSLSDSINTTVEALKESTRKEVERINSELEYAKTIQRSSLPMIFPPYPDRTDFEIYASMDPAKEVGGDFYDFELLSNNKLCFCVADVSGKGIPAALFMMRAKTLIKNFANAGMCVNEILSNVNEELCQNNDSGMFVTCWLGMLDTDTGIVQYANAGHNPPLIRQNNNFEYLKNNRPGFVLGGIDGIKYKCFEVSLKPGDEIFIYTDGVTEATDLSNELYGEDRLKSALSSISDATCENKCRLLREDIDRFVGDAPQFDDITMLSIKYTRQ